MSRTGLLACQGLLLLTGCGRYADFTLPVLPGGDPKMTYAWEPQPEPILERGRGWDSRDVLNPVVVAGSLHGSRYLNFYSGFDGRTWRTGLATSDDLVHWQKQGIVLAPDSKTWEGDYIAANGSALSLAKGGLSYWYQAGPRDVPRIGLARSADGSTWRKEPAPVLMSGPRGSWDERGVADPYVVRAGSLYLFYLGQDRAQRQRLGVARSWDGVHWEKLRSNPILELGDIGAFDENGLGEPAFWIAKGFYWMLYTGRDVHENRRLGLARSTDGVHWRKLPAVFSGTETWNSKVVCDPSVIATDTEVRVWYGGGDVARPDENINGQIGFAILRPANATLTK